MNLVIIFTSGANYNDGGIGPGAYRLNDLSAIHIFDGVVNQIKNHLNDQLRINVGTVSYTHLTLPTKSSV